MYHPTTRVLAVLELLQTHRRMTGVEMARRLEVNIRTLRRYITILQDLGVPIIAEHGRYGAYELGVGRRVPPMIFTNTEALSLALGLLAVQNLSLSEIAPAVESARAKLERVLPLELQHQFRALSESVSLDWTQGSMPSSGEVMLTLSRAIQLHQRTHLMYRSGTGAETERDFDPYGLAHYQGKWYVVGWCNLRQELRSFRLDRVTQVAPIDAAFTPPEGFDALSHVIDALANVPRSQAFELFLEIDLDTAQEENIDALGRVEAFENGVLLRGTTDDLNWLARQLAVLPWIFTVHEPEELRVALHELGTKLLSS